MSTTINVFTGTAPNVAQVDTLAISGTAPSTGDTFSVVIGSKTVTITVGATQTAVAATALLLAALQASAYGEFLEITWTSPTSTTIKGTANTPGYPFKITSFTTSGLATCTLTHTTASRGQYHYDDPLNWSRGAVPVAHDLPIVQDPNVSIRFGLDASAAISLDGFQLRTASNGQFGLPPINKTNSAAPYPEYRVQELQVLMGTGQATIETQSNLCRINVLASAVVVEVRKTGSNGAIPGILPMTLKGSAITEFINRGGLVDVCPLAGDTAAFGKLSHYSGTTRASSGLTVSGDRVYCMSGICTVGGTSTPTGFVCDGGTLTVNDSMASSGADGLQVNGGTVNWNSSGGLSDSTKPFKIAGGAKLNFSPDKSRTMAPKCQVYKAGTVSDPNGTVALTNGWTPVECRFTDVSVDWGIGRTAAIS